MAHNTQYETMKTELVSAIVLSIIVVTLVLIPLKVIGYGFLPCDDALRHSAKAVSGKNWDEILVLREGIKMDPHPGWHAVLGFVKNITGCNVDKLVYFSIAFFFLLCTLPPIFILKKPEVWIFSLLVLTALNPYFLMRLFLGRPYLAVASLIIVIGFLWQNLKKRDIAFWPSTITILLLTVLTTWIHSSWYLLFLPVVCFLAARQWRTFFILTGITLGGILIGAAFTGQPFLFLKEEFIHGLMVFKNHALQRMLVSELQPFDGSGVTVLFIMGMLMFRKLRGNSVIKAIDNPVLVIALAGWVLGFISARFWLDIGMPAVFVWTALEISDAIDIRINNASFNRVILTSGLCLALFLCATNDFRSRWTSNLDIQYLSLEKSEHKEWLPEAGGVIYSDDMGVFFQTFYKNPNAPWRYILGFESTMMPAEDIEVLRHIQRNYGAYECFQPWVEKMRPEDRVIVRDPPFMVPNIPGLEWKYAAKNTWIGRLRRPQLDNKEVVE